MKCAGCGWEGERFCRIAELPEQRCDRCGGELRTLITNSHNQDWFRPHWNENFTDKPIFVRTRSHMKELCRKYDVTSRALGDVRNVTEI